MPKPATGELRRLANGWAALITIEGRTRKAFPLSPAFGPDDEAAARERTRALAEIAGRVRRAGHVAKLPELLEDGAAARPGRTWLTFLDCVAAIAAAGVEETRAEVVPSFERFAERWTSGELHRLYPDHVPTKDVDQDVRNLRLYVTPVIGPTPIDQVTLDDADRVMQRLPERLGSSSRRHVAQLVRRVLQLAVYPARLIKENPIPRGWMPKVKQTKAFTYLYPEEDRALLATETIPLVRRLFYGVLAREGLRREELASLRFRDLELDRGAVALDENKTDDPRGWALDAGVAEALRRWKQRYRPDAAPDEPVFAIDGAPLYVLHLADQLRDDLDLAGAKRPALFERSDVRRPIRVHDLRATFVTVSLANGQTETWVADRTGHRSSEMINRYRRAARSWTELGRGTLHPLHLAIPELVGIPEPWPTNPLAPAPEQTPRGEAPTPSLPLRLPLTARSGGPRNGAKSSGEGGIRTLGTLAGTHDFQAELAIEASREAEKTSPIVVSRTPGSTPIDPPEWQRSGDRGPAVTPRAAALAAMYEQAAALASAGDLAGARAVHEAIGKLLTTGAGDVIDLSERRRGR